MLKNLLIVALVSLICIGASSAQYQYPLYQAQQYPYQGQYPYQQQYQYNPYQQQQFAGGQYLGQQQQYYPSGAGGYGYPVPNYAGANQYYPGYPVRETVVTQTPVVGAEVITTPIIETPQNQNGHYEIYEYGRDGNLFRAEIEREIIRDNQGPGPVGGQRIHRPFSVNLQRKPHYEIYKWGRSGFY